MLAKATAWLLTLVTLLGWQLGLAQVPVPPLIGHVVDQTHTLTADQQAKIEQVLAAFEVRKGSQLAVLMVNTTQPETIEQYAVRVEEKWKLGRKGVDDGVLLVIAKEDRKLRIEVGYGLEGVLPDAVAKRIIADDIAPRFKQGDFYGGVTAGVERITRVIDGEALPPPKAAPAQQRGGDNWNNLFVIGFVVVFVVGGILRAIFGRFIGAGIISVVVGIIAWSIAGVVLIALIAAIIAFIFAVANGGSGGGFSSGGGGFSSDSGGGFSGGGGSSGGGGASGSW